MLVDLACHIALEHAGYPAGGLALGPSGGDVGLGAVVAAHAGDVDVVQGGVGLTVSVAVEPVADDLARGRLEWCDTAQVGPGGLGPEALRVVAGATSNLAATS